VKRNKLVEKLMVTLQARRGFELGFDTVRDMLDVSAKHMPASQRATLEEKLVMLERGQVYSVPGLQALYDVLAAYGLTVGALVGAVLQDHELMELVRDNERLAAVVWQTLIEQIEE